MSRNSGEDAIVEILRRRFAFRSDSLEKGIGDDCAVIRPRGAREKWAVTTDMMVEGVDFQSSWQSPSQLGWKALAVNLSDLASMGARPRYCTVSLAIPPDLTRTWIRRFYDGIEKLGEKFSCRVIGGDLSRSESGVQISITALGESSGHRMLYRAGGKSEDILYVTGKLGKAAAGLSLLLHGWKRGRTEGERRALRAFREPMPRCDAGLWLARSGLVGAMMDLSDGISMDLPRLCRAGGTGAEIYLSKLPGFPESSDWGCDPLALALHGGEDFELLFTVSGSNSSRLVETYPAALPPISRVGRLTANSRVVCREKEGGPAMPLPRKGFDHFRR